MIFKSDREYNEAWEHVVLLMARDMLSNITPALSSVIPAGELHVIRDKLTEWSNKLEIIVLNNEKEGKVCSAKHSK